MKREAASDNEVSQHLGQRIRSEISALQNDHKNFKRPFIINGFDYLDKLREQGIAAFEE